MISSRILPYFLLSTLIPVTYSLSLPIDNGIKGEPVIACGAHSISVTIETEKPLSGSLYVKGFFHIPGCRLNGNFSTKLKIDIPITSACGLRRSRMVHPRGLALDSTVVLMFHPIFMTQVDKAYHVQCNYMEISEKVTRTLDVSMNAPTELPQGTAQLDDTKAPNCKYEVLDEDENGAPVKYATVGDTVYHKWTCESVDKAKYCMTVHSCTVDDGQGMGQQLVDDRGCSLDSFLLKDLNYGDDLVAGQKTQVFKFADKPTVFFSCIVRLEFKEDSSNECTIGEKGNVDSVFGLMKQDSYKEHLQYRKARHSSRYAIDVDVAASSMEVVELPEHNHQADGSIRVASTTPSSLQVCVSRLSLGLTLTILTLLVGISVFLYLEISSKMHNAGSQNKQRLHIPHHGL